MGGLERISDNFGSVSSYSETSEEMEAHCNRVWARKTMEEDDRIEEIVFERNKSPLFILKGSSKDAEIRQKKQNSGVANKELTLQDYREKSKEQWDAFQEVKKYAEKFYKKELPRTGKNSLFITGGFGTGKTYLVSALANSLINLGFDVLMATTIEINDRIRRAELDNNAKSNYYKDKCKSYDILIIDDLGKQRLTEFQLTNLFDIIDTRDKNGLPTIITCNYGFKELIAQLSFQSGDVETAKSILDRINGRAIVIKLNGRSLRG